MSGKDLLDFYIFLQHNKKDLVKVFGGVPKLEEEDEVQIITRWGTNPRLIKLITDMVEFISTNTHKFTNIDTRVSYLITSNKFLTLLSSMSCFFKCASVPFVPVNVFHPVMKVSNQIFEMILYRPSDRFFTGVKFKTPYYIKYDTLKCFYSGTYDKPFFSKSSTYSKRGVGLMQNALITERYYNSMNDGDIFKAVKTDVNYCRRVAVVERIVNGQIPFMTLDSISQLIDLLYSRLTAGRMTIEGDKFIPSSAQDADMIYIFNQLKIAHRSRCMSKGVELLPVDCMCQMKCRGPTYGKVHLNEFIDQLHQSSFATKICGLCRLSHCVENTTSAKPKKYINPENPAISSCSYDGCTTSFNSPSHFYYPLESKEDNEDGTVYELGHRAFITNSLAITDAVYKKIVSTATGRFSTVCMSGSRTCRKGIIKTIRSARQTKIKGNFHIRPNLWKCVSCKSIKPFNIHSHSLFTEDIHKTSCVGLLYRRIRSKHVEEDIIKYAPTMCLPCRMSVMCRHALQGLVNLQKEVLQFRMKHTVSKSVKSELPKHHTGIGILELLRQQQILIKLQIYIQNNTKEWKFHAESSRRCTEGRDYHQDRS